MYQNHILPYTLFPTYLPQADSLLEHRRRTDRENSSPLVPFVLFFSTERALAKLWGGWPIELEPVP
jgi:hypothetical protein